MRSSCGKWCVRVRGRVRKSTNPSWTCKRVDVNITNQQITWARVCDAFGRWVDFPKGQVQSGSQSNSRTHFLG
jgi:hypothetical protein